MRHILILFILVPIISFGGVNYNKINELKVKVEHSSDTTKVKLLFDLANYYYLTSPDTALTICKQAEAISEEIDYEYGKGESYGWIGYLLSVLGDIPNALKYEFKSLKLRKKNGDLVGVATSYNNIGLIYLNQKDYNNSISYINKAVSSFIILKDKVNLASSLINLGSTYIATKDYESAIIKFSSAIKILKTSESTVGLIYAINNLGVMYDKLGEPDKAINYYKEALSLSRESKDYIGIATSLTNLGIVEFSLGNYKKSKEYAIESFNISKKIGIPSKIMKSSKLLGNIYEIEGDLKNVLSMERLSLKMRDSIRSVEIKNSTVKQQAKYKYETKKAIDDSRHEKSLLLKQKEKDNQKKLTISVGITLVIVVIFLLFVFNRLKLTRTQKTIIETTHKELADKSLEITNSIIYAKRIQNALLPTDNLVNNTLKNSFIYYKPKDIVAGDFYWLEKTKNGVLIAAADCTGHGVPGAMVSVVCNNALNRSVREYGLTETGLILDKTKEIVVQEFGDSDENVSDGMDIALCHLEGNKLQYSGANNPLWIIRDGKIIETKANKQPIGKYYTDNPFQTHTFELVKGDTVYIFSDGYIDQFGGDKGKKLKSKGFKELLLSIQDIDISKQGEILSDKFNDWKGDLEQLDDICVIGFKY
jgi:serine phosphatase RsbU (regulator of sigma subunit)/TPR repeat protein